VGTGSRKENAPNIEANEVSWPDDDVILYDGVCVFCSRWIRFIATHFKSDAALTVLSNLPGWRWTRVFLAVPKPLRNAVYDLVAKNRYRIFGRYDACFVPDADMRGRVME
jgi:predicted DCC family thiol-disulfide oxidoreductase YuxK